MGNIEVEVKVKIHDKESLIVKLESIGFQKQRIVYEKDTYYTSPFHDMVALDEALRIREIKDMETGATSSVITYKGAKLDQVSMSRMEYETMIGDAETGRKILEGIGFESVPAVEKIRTAYTCSDCTACIDKVTNLGDFLELEIMSEDRAAALAQIDKILKELDLSMEDTTRKSYLSSLMMLEQK